MMQALWDLMIFAFGALCALCAIMGYSFAR